MKIIIEKKKLRYDGGQVMLTTVIFFLALSAIIVLGIANPILKQVRISRDLLVSKSSYFGAEGSVEDLFYRLKSGKQTGSSETLSVNGGTVASTLTNTAVGKEIIATSNINGYVRKMKLDIQLGTGISFHYGVQAGQGGFVLQNSSTITGNVFSGGSVTGNGNFIYGDVVSAGASGLIDGIHATGTAYAHNLRKSGSNPTTIDKDAYYVNKDAAVTVTGTLHPASPDQPIAPLPISDDQITVWESDAVSGGVMLSSECDSYSAASNTCTISTTRTLGPKKIPFNLLVKSSSGVLTVAGALWVTGNITTQTGPTLKISSSLGSANVALIADNPADRAGSGLITVGQSTIFQNSGAVGSFVFLISQNNSSETGGSIDALSMNQGASALVAYASHGQITLSQSVSLKEVTAYKIILQNSANVTYDTGLPSVLFESGPAGGYDILYWAETQ